MPGAPTDALALLGLARRAGAVAAGTEAARQAIRRGEAHLVVLAADAAPGQAQKVARLLRSRAVPQVRAGDRRELGRAVGGPPVSAVAVTARSFADRLALLLTQEGRRDAEHGR